MDLVKLAAFIEKTGNRTSLRMITVTNNAGAASRFRWKHQVCGNAVSRNNIPFYIDAARYAENSYFIKLREPGYAGKSAIEIAHEMFSYADGFCMSAKKDAIVNIAACWR